MAELKTGLKQLAIGVTRVMPGVVGFFLVVLGVRVCFGQLIFSDYFRVQNVEVYRDNIPSILENIDSYGIHSKTWIHEIDLFHLKQKILASHPEFRLVIVKRIFPNMLKIEIETRRPVAQVLLKRYYPVDREGRILPSPKNVADTSLPVIKGVELEVTELKVGKEYHSDRLQKALALIEAAEITQVIHLSDIDSIDVLDSKSLDFYLKNGIQIKIGKEMFSERLKMLAKTLGQLNIPCDQIRYIDLRFDDPVIGPKT